MDIRVQRLPQDICLPLQFVAFARPVPDSGENGGTGTDFLRVVPGTEGIQRVRAHNEIQMGVRHGCFQRLDGITRIADTFFLQLIVTDPKIRVRFQCQFQHLSAMTGADHLHALFEGLDPGRNEPDLIQTKLLSGSLGNLQMSAVHRVIAAAEYTDLLKATRRCGH